MMTFDPLKTKEGALDRESVMVMRPHHLLCTQGYSGKGYSPEFVRNMDSWVEKLRNREGFRVRITFSTDSLCSRCPHKQGEGLCDDDAKVLVYDRKITEYFHLEEKEYVYQELIRRINAQMTPEMLEDICGNCSWYPVSACRKNILGK